MSEQRPVPDLDDEHELDLRSLWQRLVDRWWLSVGGLIVGGVLGVLVSVGGGDMFEAKTLLYVGQPFAPGGGGQIQSLVTNPVTVAQIIRSESVVRKAATVAGLRPGQLRGNITSEAILSPGSAPRLVEITVQASAAAKAERASASLAASVIERESDYVDRKVELLNEQIARENEGLAAANTRIQGALAQQKQALEGKELPLAVRILIQANANTTLQFYEARQSNLRSDRTGALQLLSLAEKVERSRVIGVPKAVRTTATSSRNTAVIGGLIGLLLGALAAYLADSIMQRRNASPPAA